MHGKAGEVPSGLSPRRVSRMSMERRGLVWMQKSEAIIRLPRGTGPQRPTENEKGAHTVCELCILGESWRGEGVMCPSPGKIEGVNIEGRVV